MISCSRTFILDVNDITQFSLVDFLQVFDNEPRSDVHGRLVRGQGDAAIIGWNGEPAAAPIAASLRGHGIGVGRDPQQEDQYRRLHAEPLCSTAECGFYWEFRQMHGCTYDDE